MIKSTHKAEVIKIKLESHPFADKLSVCRAFGFTVCVRTEDWKDESLAIFIVPDTIVDTTRPEFAFLKDQCKESETKYRVKAKKLRQIPSFGMLIPAPIDAKEGDDYFEKLGLEHYEPPEQLSTGGEAGPSPAGHCPKYDVDSLKRYASCFVDGEEVVVSEKVHGQNSRYTYSNEQMYCGSRTEWKKYDEKGSIWKAFKNTPQIEDFCKENPNFVLYGEVYGAVQDLKYGCKQGEVKFVAFDIWDKINQKWLDFVEYEYFVERYSIPNVPILGIMKFNMTTIEAMAEGKTTFPNADHIREGVVVRPMKERLDITIGRVCLKVVGLGYLERK